MQMHALQAGKLKYILGAFGGIKEKACRRPPLLSGSLSARRSCVHNYLPSGRSEAKGWRSAPFPLPSSHHQGQRGEESLERHELAQSVSTVMSRERNIGDLG